MIARLAASQICVMQRTTWPRCRHPPLGLAPTGPVLELALAPAGSTSPSLTPTEAIGRAGPHSMFATAGRPLHPLHEIRHQAAWLPCCSTSSIPRRAGCLLCSRRP
ncbi:hypothetical protein BDA96_06G048800 [Sorghum bicolor]|uniref:Uncharacterized protein n=2 Tax=Sorghum bicolor TaxID=4558 RepID=A0A921QRT5_SORBI|nr:hypothetical protein BDA96_06G048800 [Sorghum bicolor]OQU81337.1 hypothetical protein SORBI_3006G044466 [Sorghum bicolor]